MRSKVFLFLVLAVLLPLSAQQLKSTGLIIGAGGGNISYSLPKQTPGSYGFNDSWMHRKFGMELGYRFRLQPKNPHFFYDIDLLGGIRKTESKYHFFSQEYAGESYSMSANALLSVSLSGTFNYKIVKGLYVGVGLQPSVYLWDMPDKTFDLFVTGKLGYDFGFLDLSVSYKQGLMKNLKLGYFDKCRLSEWQVSLYVPFSQHRKKK